MNADIPEKCKEITTGQTVVCEEKGRRMVFRNPDKKRVTKIRVDGCVIKNQKACDYLILTWTDREHYVELKGKNVDHALKQLAATIRNFRDKSAKEQLFAWVVSSESPSLQSKFQNHKKRFKNEFGAILTIRTNQAEHKLI